MFKTTDERVREQFETERRRDVIADNYWVAQGARPEGAFARRSMKELEACARSIVAVQDAKAASAAGRYADAVAQIDLELMRMGNVLYDARSAHSRSFDNERALCASKAVELHKLAKRVAELALDAANIAEEA